MVKMCEEVKTHEFDLSEEPRKPFFAETFGKVIGEIENQIKESHQKNSSDKAQYRLLQEAEELLKV